MAIATRTLFADGLSALPQSHPMRPFPNPRLTGFGPPLFGEVQ